MHWETIHAWLTAIFAVLLPHHAHADTLSDWGLVPIASQTSFIYLPPPEVSNFTDQYRFSLAGQTSVNFSSAYFLNPCLKGCGNPDLAFGIYDSNGGLVDASGSTTLAAGDYVFQVKGTGLGSGNTAGSGGIINFYTAAPIEVVSPAPEPAAWLLMLSGLAAVAGGLRKRRSQS